RYSMRRLSSRRAIRVSRLETLTIISFCDPLPRLAPLDTDWAESFVRRGFRARPVLPLFIALCKRSGASVYRVGRCLFQTGESHTKTKGRGETPPATGGV